LWSGVFVRVVVVTTSFPRHAEDPSGHFVASAAHRLARGGDEVHVVGPGGSPLDPPRWKEGIWVHDAGGSALFAWPGAIARAREAPWRLAAAGSFAAGVLYRLDRIGPCDRAVAHWIVPCAWPLLARSHAPLEACAHGADVRMLVSAPRSLRQRIIGSLLDRETRFTFAATASLEALAESLGPLAPTLRALSRVAAPPIDVPDVAARAKALRDELGPSARLAVVACRLIASKRVAMAIDALSEVRSDLVLVIVGEGNEHADLVRRASELEKRVVFTGALPRREALAWIAAADVLVHPSALEAAPTVVREARAFGVPVVACDAGDIAAWAENDPGITVVEATSAAMARGIERVIASDVRAPNAFP
jgi:teichuronic acid biosynthesis glycosyltransferase TuaC